MLLVSLVGKEDLPNDLLTLLFHAVPVEKGQHARKKPDSDIISGEHKPK